MPNGPFLDSFYADQALNILQERLVMPTRIVATLGSPSRFGRNDLCPCGSGRKAKRCHLNPLGPPDGVPVMCGGAVTDAPGEPWAGQRGELIAYLDAGAGDAIHAMRHVREVEKRASSVLWVVRPMMESLFKNAFPDLRSVTSVHPVPRTMRYRTTTFGLIELGSDQKWKSPNDYLNGDPENTLVVRDYLPLRVALCTRGDSTQAFDKWRSIHDRRVLQPLYDMDATIVPLDNRRGTWLATAQVLVGCNVCVSVDTGVAHLAGAMGVPLVLLDRAPGEGDPGPDDRWDEGYLQPGPLYRNVVRFRQPARGNWADPIARARDYLQRLIDEA